MTEEYKKGTGTGRGGWRGGGRHKIENPKKMYSFRLSEEELKEVRDLLAKMRSKVIILLFILFVSLPCFALTLEGGVTYTEETARIEAFEGVYKHNPLAIYLAHEKRYFFDMNATSDGKLIGQSKALIFGLIPFTTYHVVYDDKPNTEFLYEKHNGKYQLFATIDMSERNKPYPQRFIKYDKYGYLMSIEFTTGYESFVYDKDGKLVAHWEGNKGKTTDNTVNIKSSVLNDSP